MAKARKSFRTRMGATILFSAIIVGGYYAVLEFRPGWIGLTSGKTLTAFFAHLSDGRFKAARAMMTPQSRERWTLDAFREQMKRIGLTRTRHTEWRRRVSVGSLTGLFGKVETRNGSTVDLEVVMVGDEPDRRIHTVRRAYTTERKNFDDSERLRMVLDTLWDLHVGFRRGNFNHMTVTSASPLRQPRERMPGDALQGPFKAMIRSRFDLRPYLSRGVSFGDYACPGAADRLRTEVKSTVAGILDKRRAKISALGTMVLRGRIDGVPCLAFDLVFDWESRAWRLRRVKLLLVPHQSSALTPAR